MLADGQNMTGFGSRFSFVVPKGTVEGEFSLFSSGEYGRAAFVSAPDTHFTLRFENPLMSNHPYQHLNIGLSLTTLLCVSSSGSFLSHISSVMLV